MDNRHIEKIISKTSKSNGGGELRGHSEPRDLSNDSFNTIVSSENLFMAWQKFRCGKRARLDVQIFERRLEENIFNLQYQLRHGTYKHDRYHPFTICDPKQRQIHKATVTDRVVHQAVVQVIEPLFERQFIYDSFSCRKGKGTHAAIARLRTMLRRASINNTKTVYALKLDIRKFFASVNHGVLVNLIEKKSKTLLRCNYLKRLLVAMAGK